MTKEERIRAFNKDWEKLSLKIVWFYDDLSGSVLEINNHFDNEDLLEIIKGICEAKEIMEAE